MLGAISQFETEIRVERQMDGIVKTKNYGVKLGKKKSLPKEKLDSLKQKRNQGIRIKNLMQDNDMNQKINR